MKFDWYNNFYSAVTRIYDEKIQYYLHYPERRFELGDWSMKIERYSMAQSKDYEDLIKKIKWGFYNGFFLSLLPAAVVYRKSLRIDYVSLYTARIRSVRVIGKFTFAGVIYCGSVFALASIRNPPADDTLNHFGAGVITASCFLPTTNNPHFSVLGKFILLLGAGTIGLVYKCTKTYPIKIDKPIIKTYMNATHWKGGILGTGDMDARRQKDKQREIQADLNQQIQNEYFIERYIPVVDQIRGSSDDGKTI
ncbi:hypothetical protein GJ496_011302 [Pomphorhynchus laevis]|nr:hypothetical protein GJ496_011302 [Pomphorhynchus laevis]